MDHKTNGVRFDYFWIDEANQIHLMPRVAEPRKIRISFAHIVVFAFIVAIGIFGSHEIGKKVGLHKGINQIVDAIYLIEGENKARQPFGIESVNCDGYDDCRQVAYNTVRNNWIRYNATVHPSDTFFEFLAKRYCPFNWEWWHDTLIEKLRKD